VGIFARSSILVGWVRALKIGAEEHAAKKLSEVGADGRCAVDEDSDAGFDTGPHCELCCEDCKRRN